MFFVPFRWAMAKRIRIHKLAKDKECPEAFVEVLLTNQVPVIFFATFALFLRQATAFFRYLPPDIWNRQVFEDCHAAKGTEFTNIGLSTDFFCDLYVLWRPSYRILFLPALSAGIAKSIDLRINPMKNRKAVEDCLAAKGHRDHKHRPSNV